MRHLSLFAGFLLAGAAALPAAADAAGEEHKAEGSETAQAEPSGEAFNVVDTLALVSTGAATLPASGIATVQAMNGRTDTARLRHAF